MNSLNLSEPYSFICNVETPLLESTSLSSLLGILGSAQWGPQALYSFSFFNETRFFLNYYLFIFGCSGSLLFHDMWDLSFPIRDETHTPCIGGQIFHHWTTKKVPFLKLLWPFLEIERSRLQHVDTAMSFSESCRRYEPGSHARCVPAAS